ncbi:c-type heme family protein [Desulfovibrio inopinatus]|uniref:c-type heme family protein n=1 Tax=Desulfovibrio inopinatus TaxID=102109 RepID=UPI001FDF6B44|nr:DUF3365 domain-containing protein [Desulfovibrio inopinatus]
MSTFLETEVREKAKLVLSQVDSVQRYVRSVLRPAMYSHYPDTFILEAMSSSYISRRIMGHAEGLGGEPLYRRVAIHARNPDYEANVIEQDLIDTFRAHPKKTVWEGYRSIDGENFFIMARPAVFKKSCMHCHGDPAEAPAELVHKYGDRGFGHGVGSIDGLDLVGVPVSSSVARVQSAVLTYLIFFGCAVLLFFASVNLLFRRVVVNNIRVLVGAFRHNLGDDQGEKLLREIERGDEIGEMTQGIERLGEHLAHARDQLEDYAQNLEAKVADRTEELVRETGERQEDVRLFLLILAALNTSQTRPSLWRSTLPRIAERFRLERVSYVCAVATNRHYSWPESDTPPDLPPNWVKIITEGQPIIETERAFVPVDSFEGIIEGFLCLYRNPGDIFRPQDHELLRAVGRQLGIAAENIAALDGILRHTENLKSVFEGIGDPLLLLDTNGTTVVANDAARRLAREVAERKDTEEGDDVKSLFKNICSGHGERSDCDLSLAIKEERQMEREVMISDHRSLLVRLYPIGGESRRVIAHLRETTHEKQMLSQAARSEKMVTVGRLAAGLAHEINNPLGVILCYAELLKKSLDDTQQHEDLDVIVRHTRQAQAVLKDLLNFARPKVAPSQTINLTEVVATVVKVFSVQAEKRGAALTLHAEENLPVVRVDQQTVEHIAANLILNALDAAPDHAGQINIELHGDHASSRVVMTIQDNGPGLSDEDLAHIFEPFYTTKAVNKGTGLGLAVVYGFMQDIGGDVTAGNASSSQGGGAIFTLRFPVADMKES